MIFSESFKEELQKKTSFLLAVYHRDIITVLYFIKVFKVLGMTSASKEGQLITQFFNFFGSQTVRGSSRNNSVSALKSFIRRLREDTYCASIAVDGPKGPPLKAKPGILEISRIAKKNVYSIGTSCSSFWTLKSTWDHTRIPKPFSRVVYHIDLVQERLKKDQDPRDEKILNAFEDSLMKNYKKALGILEQKS